MLTTKKTFQTKVLSTLLILALVSTMILAPTALAAGVGGSSITTAVADSGVRNFTPTEAANDTEIQAMTDNSSVLNESDIIYMILTDRFYDADPTNNGTLNQEYRPGQLKYTQGGDWKGITQKLDYIKNLGVTAIWISPPSQNELLSRDGEESGYGQIERSQANETQENADKRMKKQYHLICIVASLLFWLVGCCAIQIKDVPASISQEPLENEEISNSEQAESPLEAEDSTSVTITESGDFSEAEQLGFTGANIGQGGLMAGDGEWVYYRSESDWGLYRARTDGSEQTQLLPPEDYAPSSINVLGDWVYFSNFRDGFSLWRVRTDGSEAEKLVDGYCHTFLVAESGIYFDCRNENNVMRTFHAELDGSAQTLLYESCAPTTYYEGKLYLYDFRSGTLYAYNTEANEREILFEGKYDAAFFSADDTGIYFWDDMCDYCHLDPETKEITVLHQGPIGDYFNYYDGTVYYVAYGGENYDYDCCYAMDVKTGEQKAILSLSPEMYDAFGDPIGITQVDYRNGNYDADSIPTNEEGWPMALNELVDGLFVVNGQVFARGRLARTGMAETWILCDGASGTVWG